MAEHPVTLRDVQMLVGHAEILERVRGEEEMPRAFRDLALRMLDLVDGSREEMEATRRYLHHRLQQEPTDA